MQGAAERPRAFAAFALPTLAWLVVFFAVPLGIVLNIAVLAAIFLMLAGVGWCVRTCGRVLTRSASVK